MALTHSFMVKLTRRITLSLRRWTFKVPYILSGKRNVIKFETQATSRQEAKKIAVDTLMLKCPVDPLWHKLKMKRSS